MIYEYQCTNCGKEWEENRKMDDRKIPTEGPCPQCGVVAVRQKISGGGIADPIRLGKIKPPSGFNEVLKNIKKISPGNSINVRD